MKVVFVKSDGVCEHAIKCVDSSMQRIGINIYRRASTCAQIRHGHQHVPTSMQSSVHGCMIQTGINVHRWASTCFKLRALSQVGMSNMLRYNSTCVVCCAVACNYFLASQFTGCQACLRTTLFLPASSLAGRLAWHDCGVIQLPASSLASSSHQCHHQTPPPTTHLLACAHLFSCQPVHWLAGLLGMIVV